jgi:tetratricopeptide (TPR) repeat protein
MPSGLYRKSARNSICLLLNLVIFFIPVLSNAQFNPSPNCQKAYQKIVDLRFIEARQFISAEKKSDPSNLIPLYLENFIDFLTIIVTDEKAQYERIKPVFLSRMKSLEDGHKDSPYRDLCLGGSNIQWAFIQMQFGEYTQAALKIRKAHRCFTENAVAFPDFLPNNIGLGITHMIGGMVPDSYKWVSSLMGLDGTLSQGLAEVKTVADYKGSDPFYSQFRTEALFYLSIVSASLIKDKAQALKIISLFNESDGSQSPVLAFARASILMKNGLNEQALNVLIHRPRDPLIYPFHYLEFMEGNARLNKLDTSAMSCFRDFLKNYRGVNFIQSAWQKIGWLKLLRGDTSGYFSSMNKILNDGKAVGEDDKQAFAEAESKVVPNVILLRARLLFDGGYYSKALSELLDRPIKSFLSGRKDYTEYFYRLGRIYHESGNTGKALSYYHTAIQRGKNDPWYFAASAALQSGIIHEQKGEFSSADSAYKVCLECRNTEYKYSLAQKAKAGISRIKSQKP